MDIKKLLALGATLLMVAVFFFNPQSCCGDFGDTTPPADAAVR
jgi:hypothetical protein